LNEVPTDWRFCKQNFHGDDARANRHKTARGEEDY